MTEVTQLKGGDRKMKKLPILLFSLLLIATISSLSIPVVLAERRSYDTIKSISGYHWYYWNSGSDKAVIVLFGGHVPYLQPWLVKIHELYNTYCGIDNCDACEYSDAKVDFIEELHANGYDVLTIADHGLVYSGGENWVRYAATWLFYHGYAYKVNLFGFSGGGVVVAKEIQRSHAYLYSAAVVASAPVHWAGHSGIFQSAHTASEATVRTSFIAPVNDFLTYPQMPVYYNNMVVNKEWHNWNGGHDPFPNKCADPAHPGEKVSDAAYNWYQPHYSLTVNAINNFGNYVPTEVYIDGQWEGMAGDSFYVVAGNHYVGAEAIVWDEYGTWGLLGFDCGGLGENPVCVSINSDTTVTAVYQCI
ncbi:MAG: hypothetical protein OEZ47_17820 [Gammaproteobacteria bacterium]|nr:hypothetical protein [Gammaproteobacteria bacterium]